MKNRHFHTIIAGAICSLALFASPQAKAQRGVPDAPDGLPLGELVQHSITLMQFKQWPKALLFSEQAIKDESDGALEKWGPLFGSIYYRKGICEMKLKKWGAAASSFEKCYKDFPNKKDAMNENEFEKRALFQWAKAEMGREDWQKALDLFKKFLNEREHPRDRFSQGDFFISRARCYYKLEQVVPGNQSFESGLQNKIAYKVPDVAVINCFKEMVEACLAKENEQAIVDFIKKNRGHIVANDDEMYPFSGVLLKLAQDAMKAEMKRASIMLYQLIPTTERAIDFSKDTVKRIGKLPGVMSKVNGAMFDRKLLEQRVTRLQTEMNNTKGVEIFQLMALAFLHEKEGNTRSAHAAYRQLEDYYSHAEKREDNLFNMARTSFMVDGGSNALPDAQKFLAQFPQSKHAPIIKRLMFASLFAEQRYEECIESASQMIGQLKPGTQDHDICLHVLGGSYFYTGQYETAKPLLDQHVELYPESDSKTASAYFHAANYYRLMDIPKAAELLGAFIEKFPTNENPFLPFALLDRATCHYMDEENEPTIEVTTRIIEEYKDHSVEDQAYNLRGNAHLALENNKDAERDYLAALEIARRWDHEVVAAEALFSLADLCIAEGEALKGDEGKARMMEAKPFIEQFWKDYGTDSPLRRQMSVLQIPVLIEDKRLEEALAKLREIISELAAEDNIMGLEKTLPHYTEAYMTAYTPEQLREHYRALPGISLDMKAARALIAIEIITVFEKVTKKAEGEDAKMAAQATVTNLFKDLKKDFDLKDLATSILISVGDYLRSKTSTPREALPFYTEVLERKEEQYRLAALLGRGYIYGLSPLPGDIDKGLEDYRAVVAETEDDNQKEEALFHIVRLLMNKKDFAGAETQAKSFLDKANKFSKMRRGKVFLMLGESYELRKQEDNALGIYARVWSGHMGNISASAPAMQRWMEILWMRNKPPANPQTLGDRQGAYEGGWDFLKNTRHFKDKLSSTDLVLWQSVEKLVRQYEANPGIQPKTLEKEN